MSNYFRHIDELKNTNWYASRAHIRQHQMESAIKILLTFIGGKIEYCVNEQGVNILRFAFPKISRKKSNLSEIVDTYLVN